MQAKYVAQRRLPVEKPIGKTGKTRTVRVKDTTIQRDLNVLGAALHHAAFFERIPASPPVMSLAKEDPRERFLTRAEVARIFSRLRGKSRHLLLFARLALYTGARTGAILDLTWDRVDLARGLVSYPRPGRKASKKKRVVVPIEPDMIRALTAAKRRAKTDHVIEWRGKRVTRIVRAFRRHLDALGMRDVSPHIFRHTFATWAASAGQPLHAIGGVLGQSVAHTTERYAKQQPEAKRKVVRAMRRK
jgi:integrase